MITITPEEIMELIGRRRRQIIVHSVIYYRFNNNLIADHTFDRWCKELVDLQDNYPDLADNVVFSAEFKGFRGETGFHFATIPWGIEKASFLMKLYRLDYFTERGD